MWAVRDHLLAILQAAIDVAQPEYFLAHYLPAPPSGRLIILSAGKAGAAMVAAAENHYLDRLGVAQSQIVGVATCRHGYGAKTRIVPVIEAGHPVPDEAGIAAANEALALAQAAGPDDLVLVLLSGGGSANWVAPAGQLTLAEKQALTKDLQRAGATIGELNCVRKHLSRIKGGRLAQAARPARLVTLAISDVPGDNPSVIASGPTVGDESTLHQARDILTKYAIIPVPAIAQLLSEVKNETPKPDDFCFGGSKFVIVLRPREALETACRKAEGLGYAVISLGADIEGEARKVAKTHAAMALNLKAQGQRAALISGGELTVTVTGKGRGGPNQEYVLALAQALQGTDGIYGLSADTDGTDGGTGLPSDPAGAIATPDTLSRARGLQLHPADFLATNDATACFEALNDLIVTGPTRTNVNDLRIILVDA